MKDIMQIIDKAYELHQLFGQALIQDNELNTLLKRLNQNIMATKNQLILTGVVKECADCAVHGEGTCCSNRTGYKCDSILILLNLLLGNPPVIQTEHSHLCPFLSEQGCSLIARPVICVNFICQRLRKNIPHVSLVLLQNTAGEEIDTLFTIEEHIKNKIQYL